MVAIPGEGGPLMANPFLIGARLYLRPLEESDIPTCLRWINDPEVTRTLSFYRPFNGQGRTARRSWGSSSGRRASGTRATGRRPSG